MHEMSIAEGIIDIVERTAQQHQVAQVKEVRISVGELSGVDIDSLQFAWSSVTRGGVAQGATLVIERPPGQAWCMDCSVTVPLKQYGQACPKCQGYHLTPTGGTEMRVIDIVPADAPTSEAT